MAVLTAPQRAIVNTDIMRALSEARESCSLTKAEWLAAVDAADDWIDSNAAEYNSALPTVARTNLTASQKARLIAIVILKRWTG